MRNFSLYPVHRRKLRLYAMWGQGFRPAPMIPHGVAALLLLAGGAMSQNPDFLQMPALDFERTVFQAADQNRNEAPPICRAVIDRLKAGRAVSDRVILRCAEAHITAADRHASPGAPKARVYHDAEQYIQDVLGSLSDRDLVTSQLQARLGDLAVAAGDFRKAAALFQSSYDAIESLHLDVDVQRISTLVKLGQSYLSFGQKKDAERTFLEAMAYQWYTITGHPMELQQLRDQYLLAARGLITSRRGDLRALDEIVFVPATQNELGPVLQRAIDEAKGIGR
ncbi:MAG: tetratricopeptide repeat protein [Acidobacteriota bacterium]|nr:tetratricopeptide repeat protein [Acidobacteriota bacterium]